MTKVKSPRVDILAEDNRLVSFCLKIVMKLGIQTERKKISVEPVPQAGAGYTWLFREYPSLVQKHRTRASKNSVALVVGVDADKKSPEERAQELDQKLEEAKLEKRKADEAIVLVIPKRNIETWIMYFGGTKVDETTDYKTKVGKKPDIELTAKGFVEEYRIYNQKPEEVSTLPSLVATYKELRRVLT